MSPSARHEHTPRWLPYVAFGAACLFFGYAFVLRVSPSVMVRELMREFAVGAGALGNLSGAYLFVYAGLQIPVGVLLDRYGVRRLMSVAALATGLGALLFASAHALGMAYAGRVLIGGAAAFSWPGMLLVAHQWFPARFALLGGIGQAVGMAGAAAGQAPLAAAVAAHGWRATMAALAAAGLLLAAGLWLCVRDRQHPGSRDHGLYTRLLRVLGNGQTWLAAFFGLAMASPILSFGGLWGVPYLTSAYGLGRTSAAALVSLVFVGAGLMAPLVGFVSDRMGRRKPSMYAGGVLCTLAMTGVLWPGELALPVLGVLLFLVGAGGCTLVLAFAAGRENNSPATAGAAIGVVNTVLTGGGALFQPLIGALLDLAWNGASAGGVPVYTPHAYRLAISVLPAVSAAGTLALSRLAETGHRRRGG